MDPIRDFDADVEWMLDACVKRLAAYPPSLRRPGRAYLEKQWSVEEKKDRGFSITHLLPFWLQEICNLDRQTCRLIALSNTFWLLYFFLQDEVMDAGPDEYRGYLLPLGNLFYLDAIAPYRSLLYSASPFWTYLEQYIAQWADSVTWEREQHWLEPREFEPGDLLRLAGKSAPLKIPCAAVSLLAGRQELLGPLEEMIDNILVVSQLMDDLRDWRQDLAQKRYTYFLMRVMAERGLRPPSTLTKAQVEKSLFVGAVLEELYDLMALHGRRALESIAAWRVPYLEAHIRVLNDECRQLREGFRQERARWIQEQFAPLLLQNDPPGA